MGDIYRASMLTEVNGVQTVNVMHWQEQTVGTNPNREEEVKNLLTVSAGSGDFANTWQTIMSDAAIISCVKVQKVFPLPESTAKHFFVNVPGTAGSTPAPSNLALVIRQYSSVATKRGRGRSFFAGLDEVVLDGGNYITALVSILTVFTEQYYLGFTTGDGSVYTASIYSKQDDVYRDCVMAHYDPIPRNQRDRKGKLCGT